MNNKYTYFYPIINQFRLCFHSDIKIRVVSHKKVINFYIESLINQTESEEKLNRPTTNDEYEYDNIINIEQERVTIDELTRISNFDLFHYDDIKKCAHKYQQEKQKRNESLKDLKSASFDISDINKIISILSNKTLEYNLRITASNQLFLIFTKNRSFWNILRDNKILNILINGVTSTINNMKMIEIKTNNKSHESFIVSLLEIIKLRFETSIFLDELDCDDLNEYEQILKQLLPLMFIPNTKI